MKVPLPSLEGGPEEEGSQECGEGPRQVAANLGEAKGKVPKEVRFLHLAVPAGIAESQTTWRIIARGRKESVCAVGVQTTK